MLEGGPERLRRYSSEEGCRRDARFCVPFLIGQVAQERSVRAAARRTEKVEAFRGWSRLKAIKEAAVRCLQDIDAPEKAAERGSKERWLEVRGGDRRRERGRGQVESN